MRPERAETVLEGANNASEGANDASEITNNAPMLPEGIASMSELPGRPEVEGPTASIHLNPRRNRGEISRMNIQSTNTKSYFAALDRVRQLREECNWTQRQALTMWMAEVTDPEEGFIDTSIPDVLLRAMKAAKKGKNPDLPSHCETMEGPHEKV